MTEQLPSFLEDHISQIPALQLLQNLGWRYLTPAETVTARGGRRANVLLEEILVEQLRKLNRIRFKGEEYAFSEANIQNAVLSLKDVLFDGLVRTNEKIYDLLVLGKSLQQTISGDTKSFPMRYIDWDPATWLTNNVFHVSEEFEVERTGSQETRRPDIVLFINGIPVGVIECKRPDLKDAIGEAISQQLRNQRDDEIPKLFLYSQLLVAISKNESKYATTGTPSKFWAVWKEDHAKGLETLINTPLSEEQKERLFAERYRYVRQFFDRLEESPREVTEQDKALFWLCRPERLLELIFHFTLFDAGEKKVARYQQYFTVRNAIERIRHRDAEGRRQGGVVWHTQGSGKSLTMVMMAKAIAREKLPDYKLILVTDRTDLDEQIYDTFRHCDMDPHRARTGRDLAAQINSGKSRVVTTIIDKFEMAVLKGNLRNESDNIFVLVDESHRGQYGAMHGRMRKALPNGCFIGFTGTPVKKREKDTINKFGGLVQPTYSIRKAVEDQAVVPLLYEGRDVEQRVDRQSIDKWFDVITKNLTKEQRADLKKKFTTTDQLNKAEQKVKEIALDISVHFRDNWQGTPYKAQLVTQDKATALLYKKYLDEFGMVVSEVLISGPDTREGNEEVDEENLPAVQQFWKKMMTRHGSEEQYNRNVINAFKNGDEVEIIIVVDKLLTGFDAPRNTVLYLTRQLKEHKLLQAIARVNRLYEGKDFGYIIDYRGVLGNLNSAFETYGQLEEFDIHDLEDTLTDVTDEIDKLPRRHTELLNLFQDVRNKRDEEQYERLLADESLRDRFFDCLRDFGKSLAMAFSSTHFMEHTPNEKVERYRKDLVFFMNLRASVKRRYALVVDFKEYEAKIQKLLDTHVSTGNIEKVTNLVNIFEKDAFQKEIEKLEGVGSKADTIAHRTKKTITERMDDDPAFYKRFSEMLEEAIKAFRERRLADRDYLARVNEIAEGIRNRRQDDLPQSIRNLDVARAFFGILVEALGENATDTQIREELAQASMRIDTIICSQAIVNWTSNQDIRNRMQIAIEDELHELKTMIGTELTFQQIDSILEKCMDVAGRRYNR